MLYPRNGSRSLNSLPLCSSFGKAVPKLGPVYSFIIAYSDAEVDSCHNPMADQQTADQFTFWNTSLAFSIKETNDILTSNPIHSDRLTDAFTGLKIDLEKVLSFQPSSKTKAPYSYADALLNVSQALRFEQRVLRIIGPAPSVLDPSNNGSMSDTASNSNTICHKIPEIPISQFLGTYSAYKTFITSFRLKAKIIFRFHQRKNWRTSKS